MPKVNVLKNNFSIGELAPTLYGRSDTPSFQNGAETMLNCYPMIGGGATRRPGSVYVATTKTSGKAVRLIPFVYSTTVAYMLEFGHNYIRVFKNGAPVLSAGVPYEVATTYGETELFDLSYTQESATLYITHPGHAPAELICAGDTSWTLSTISFTSTPAEWTSGNYPKTVTLFEQRLVLAGSNAAPQKVWGTKSGTRNNLTMGTLDDDAYAFTLASDTVCPILWMLSTKVVTLLTYSGEFTMEGGSDKALTPSNVKIANRSSFGATFVKPMKIGNEIVFVQRAGRKLRTFAYNFSQDAYEAPDLCALANHVTSTSGIKEMCYAQEPHTLIWSVRNDGVLLSCSYEKTQSLLGWARHTTDGLFESVATVPYGSEDQVWVVVNRDGVRTVEYLSYSANTDCASLQTSGTPTATWSGLTHLNGYEVDIVADGVPQPRQMVSGGAVTLSRTASSVQIGLPYTSTLVDLPVEVQGAGTVQGSRVSVNEVTIRLYNTSACTINSQTIAFRQFGIGVLDQAITPFTGDKDIHLTTGWNDQGQITLQQADPLPWTVLGIFKKVSVND